VKNSLRPCGQAPILAAMSWTATLCLGRDIGKRANHCLEYRTRLPGKTQSHKLQARASSRVHCRRIVRAVGKRSLRCQCSRGQNRSSSPKRDALSRQATARLI
jgi:hypothetical protein